MIEKDCPVCGYQFQVTSAGVFESESGCMRVYAEEEQFHCPRCHAEDRDTGGGKLYSFSARTPLLVSEYVIFYHSCCLIFGLFVLIQSQLFFMLSPVDHREGEVSASKEPAATDNRKTTPVTEKKPHKESKQKKKTSKSGNIEQAMAEFVEYQKGADDKYLQLLKEQGDRDAKLRQEEIQAQKESSEVFARMISEALISSQLRAPVLHSEQQAAQYGNTPQFQNAFYQM